MDNLNPNQEVEEFLLSTVTNVFNSDHRREANRIRQRERRQRMNLEERETYLQKRRTDYQFKRKGIVINPCFTTPRFICGRGSMEVKRQEKSSLDGVTSTIPAKIIEPPLISFKKKRKFSDVDIHNSYNIKIRSIVHRLRPLFVEILSTPDFKNSKASHEIKSEMKAVVDLYKKMVTKMEPKKVSMMEKQAKGGLHSQAPPVDGADRVKLTSEPPPQSAAVVDNSRMKNISEKLGDDLKLKKSYIIGGSVFGWNFITFGSSKPAYYGVTKELFRSSHPKTEI